MQKNERSLMVLQWRSGWTVFVLRSSFHFREKLMVCALEQIEKNRSKLSWSKNCQGLSKENFVRFRNKVVNESIHYDKDFLLAEAETLDSCGGYKTAKEKVVASHFANNCAECAIKVATDFNLALLHDKEQRQLTFQVIELMDRTRLCHWKKTLQTMKELSNYM